MDRRGAMAPSPGPGPKGMKPKGLVLAASITSQTLIPKLWQVSDLVAKAILTLRNVFCRSFAVSAQSVEETGTTSR